MGRTTTPTFRLEMQDANPYHNYSGQRWDTKNAGRPNDANLAKDIAHFEASTREGGCNAHLGEITITKATVIRQSNNEVVATYTAG